MKTNHVVIAAKLSEHRHAWVNKLVRAHVRHWRILLVEITQSEWLSKHLIGVQVETAVVPSIHAGTKTALQTRVYVKGRLIGEFKEFINAKKTQPKNVDSPSDGKKKK